MGLPGFLLRLFTMKLSFASFLACVSTLSVFQPGISAAADYRLVVQFKSELPTQDAALTASEARGPSRVKPMADMSKVQPLLQRLASTHRTTLESVRQFRTDSVVVKAKDVSDIDTLMQRMRSDPAVASVAVDRRIRLHAQSPLVGVLNSLDLSLRPRFWHHRTIDSQPASINTESMWLNFHGGSKTVVAVLDTGILANHPALQGHVLPGFDFVSDAFLGNDGQSTVAGSDRDDDASDPGDGVTPAALAQDPACLQVSDSSWHGTFTAAMIAGNASQADGVFPVSWNSVILPVRVLGRCGGFSTDLADGIRWAAGLDVPGVPSNPNPAKVLNLSLGSNGTCVNEIEGSAVTAARAAGALVVAAAGNDGGVVDSPADCPGAFGVAALDQQGYKAFYSNFGAEIDLSAPGGDSAYPMWSAGNAGLTSPGTHTYRSKIGSSFASPLVAAAAAQIFALRPGSTVDNVESDLKGSARPFLSPRGSVCAVGSTSNVQCRCTTSTCGAGMLDIARAINFRGALPLVNLFSNTGNVLNPGASKEFSAEGSTLASSDLDQAVAFRIGTVVRASGSTANPTISVAGLKATVGAPTGVNGFELIARGSSGAESSAFVTVAQSQLVAPALVYALLDPVLSGSTVSSTAPISSGSGSDTTGSNPQTGGSTPSTGGNSSSGGGGGSTGLLGVFLLACLLIDFKRKMTVKPARSTARR